MDRTRYPAVCAGYAAVGLVLVIGAYYPGLSGPFVLDDLPAIVDNAALRIPSLSWDALSAAAWSGASGLLGRPLAYLSFALNYYAAGEMLATPFKLTNLAIHFANGLLVYCIARRLLPRFSGAALETAAPGRFAFVALLAAGLWLVHPIQLTSVLYVVQRMTSLSALGVLAGLLAYIAGRSRLEAGRRRGLLLMVGGTSIGTALGLLSKESAALLPALVAVVEVTAFDARRLDRSRRRGLVAFYGIFLAVPVLAGLTRLALDPAMVLDAYKARPFDLWQRLMTEPRVLFYYLRLIALPRTSDLGLVHDDIAVSASLLSPASTVVALAAWPVLVAVALKYRRRAPAAAFAVLWFVVGHALESTVIALEIAHEHRNYLPSFGIILAGAHYLAVWSRHRRWGPVARRGTAAAGIALLALITHARAQLWSEEGRLVESLVRHHPRSPRAHGLQAQFLIDAGRDRAEIYRHLRRLAALDPTNVSGLLEMMKTVRGRRLAIAGGPGLTTDAPVGARWDRPLPTGARELSSVEAAIAGELEDRLRTQPVVSSSVQGLVEFKECVRVRMPVCDGLGPFAQALYEAAVSNPRVTDRHRAILWLHAAMLRVIAGEPGRAIAFLENAVRYVPGDLNFRLRQVELYLSLGRYAGAAALVEAMAGIPGLSTFDRERISTVRAYLETLRESRPPGREPEVSGRPPGHAAHAPDDARRAA